MKGLAEAMDKMISLAAEDARVNGPWEEGDEEAFVFNDGVGILSLEGDTFKINIIAGKPKFIDYNLDIIEDVDQEDEIMESMFNDFIGSIEKTCEDYGTEVDADGRQENP